MQIQVQHNMSFVIADIAFPGGACLHEVSNMYQSDMGQNSINCKIYKKSYLKKIALSVYTSATQY